jgi:hypothetical protein
MANYSRSKSESRDMHHPCPQCDSSRTRTVTTLPPWAGAYGWRQHVLASGGRDGQPTSHQHTTGGGFPEPRSLTNTIRTPKRTGTWDGRVYRRVQFGDSGSIKGTAKEQVKVVSEGGLSGKRKPASAGRVFGSLRSKRIFALSVSECNPLDRRDADSKLRFKSLKESKGLISATCGREYTTLVEYAVREGEVTARIDKIAVPKRAVLKLAVINQNPIPLEGTIRHHLDLE